MKYKSNRVKFNVLFLIGIVLLFCVFFVKLTYISTSEVVEGVNLSDLDKSRTITTKKLTAHRGNIFDYNGEYLAQNVNSYTAIAILSPSRTTDERYPKHVVNKEDTAKKLASILEPLNKVMTEEYILKLLNTKAYQVELGPGGRGLSELVKKQIQALALPGIEFVSSVKRYYQKGDFASYIIGYAKVDSKTGEMVGELGIEGFTDRYLKGKDGSITYQKDAYGYQIANTESYIVPAEDGYDVYLTIDSTVQMFIDNAIAEFEHDDPKWVTITIADAKTGAIVGSSTSPSFDPNTKEGIQSYNNPLTSITYEPGSTMKIFSFGTAIEEGVYKGDELYSSGKISVADYKIKDWNKTGWGSITYDTGFTYSSNVAAVKLEQKVTKKSGKKTLINYYNNLGFGSKTGIELSNEYTGTVDVEYETELASASYGQGITVTPVQMIQALTSLTNDGTTLKPYIIDKIIDPNTNETVYKSKRVELNKVYSTSTVNKLIELMDLTVNGEDKAATGVGYRSDNVRLVGKTGTANYTTSTGGYVTGTYNNIRSFAGVFPKEDPKYIIYVAVKDFKGTSKRMGGYVKNMVESIATYKNINERESDKNDLKSVKVPNILNKTLLTALNKLNETGINYVIIGNGSRVIKQYPASSTITSKSSKVFVVTNGDEYKMPNMKNWSSKEVKDFCDIVKINCEYHGYGYVVSTNLKTNDIINDETKLVVALKNIDPLSLAEEELDEEDEKEEQ